MQHQFPHLEAQVTQGSYPKFPSEEKGSILLEVLVQQLDKHLFGPAQQPLALPLPPLPQEKRGSTPSLCSRSPQNQPTVAVIKRLMVTKRLMFR